jgi:hypothetical protein
MLTLEDHRAIGAALTMIHSELNGHHWGRFKENSEVTRRRRRADRNITYLRVSLVNLVDDHSIYFGPRSRVKVNREQALIASDIGEVLTRGRVSDNILTVYLRLERSLMALRMALDNQRPQDVYMEDRALVKVA